MTRSEVKQLQRIASSGTACAVNLASFLKSKVHRKVTPQFTIKRREKKRLSRKGLVACVRPIVEARANGECECGCGLRFGSAEYTPEWDEFYGRRNVSVETTWMLTRQCHRAKTENQPTREAWDGCFSIHCARYGYPFRERAGRAARSAPKPFISDRALAAQDKE